MSAPSQSQPAARAWVVVTLLAGVNALNFLDRQLLSILAEPVKADLLLTDTQLGLLSGLAFALFYTVFGIPVAWMADRSNRVRIVAGACALWSLFTAACGYAQNFGQLALARVGVAVGEAGGSPPSYSIISDYVPKDRRATALAIYSLGVPVGTTIGAALGGWIAAEHGWRTAFIAIGLIGVVYACMVLLLVREPRRGQFDAVAVQSVPLKQTVLKFAVNPTLRFTVVAAALSAFVGYAMLNWTPALLMRTKGMRLEEVAAYYSLTSGIAGAIGMVVSGYLVDRFGKNNRRVYGLVPALAFLLAVPFYLVGIWSPQWGWSLVALAIPFAVYAAYLPSALAIVQNSVSPAERSTASAILLFIINIVGLGGGPLFVGAISDAAARDGLAEPLQLAMFMLAPVFLLAAIGHFQVARSIGQDEAF
ncbi:MAG TPA: MFS transporter [Novosphingobium sp.]|nr:MFS transporter [Novosphingobium sp.]